MSGEPVESGDLEVPAQTTSDIARSLVCVGLAAIPWVGGSASVAFDKFVPSAYIRRVEAWQTQITAAVIRIQQTGVTTDALLDDDRFVAAVVRTTRVALESESEEKLVILRRALEGSILHSVDAVQWEQMSRLVERLSVLQVSMLGVFTLRPRAGIDESFMTQVRQRSEWGPAGPRIMVEDCLRDTALMNDENVATCKLAWRELQSLGLVSLDLRDYVYSGTATFPSMSRRVLRDEAEDFLDFLDEPEHQAHSQGVPNPGFEQNAAR